MDRTSGQTSAAPGGPASPSPGRARAMKTNTTHHRHDDHGDGLHDDLVKLATRQDALRIFGAGSAAAILATLGASTALAATPTAEVPDETAGTYPGDSTNGPDVLDDSGIVRHDIRRSFGESTTLATGVPLRVNLTVTDAANDYAPLSGLAVYLWHCDRSGRYSMYTSGVEDENYLRGIAKTDSEGTAWFKTIFPGRLFGALATHPLRGLCVGRQGGLQRADRQDLADRVARSGLQEGLRDQRIRGQSQQPRADITLERHGLRRRQSHPPTRDGDRKCQERLRREPHHRHLRRCSTENSRSPLTDSNR